MLSALINEQVIGPHMSQSGCNQYHQREMLFSVLGCKQRHSTQNLLDWHIRYDHFMGTREGLVVDFRNGLYFLICTPYRGAVSWPSGQVFSALAFLIRYTHHTYYLFLQIFCTMLIDIEIYPHPLSNFYHTRFWFQIIMIHRATPPSLTHLTDAIPALAPDSLINFSGPYPHLLCFQSSNI